ncbi:MAG: hypothetical protein AB8G11_01065 [Saprospiraceae bacterium]
MFTTKKEILSDSVNRYKIYQNNRQLTYNQVLELLKNNADFRLFYNDLLVQSPFEAFFWENPPITKSTIQQPYEFVLVNSNRLSRVEADNRTFSKFFSQHKNTVVSFENLGKDALLVVPKPMDKLKYPHIAHFVRNAPKTQLQEFWQQVGEQVENRISNKKLWISTSGLGVYWLHIRLDDRPKYYTFQSYKS